MRTMLVIASIAVGVFAVGTIASAYVIFSEDVNVSYAASHPANIDIATDLFDENFVKTIRDLPEIKDAEGRYIINVRLRQVGGTWKNHDLVAIDNFNESDINTRTPLEGEFIPGERQVIIEKNALNDTVYQVGDILELQLDDNTIRKIPVVGIVQDPTAAGGDFLAAPKAYISMDTLDWLDQPRLFNRILATTRGDSDNEEAIKGIARSIEEKLEKTRRNVYRTTTNKTNEHPMASTALAIIGILGVLGVLVAFLSGSLITNTLNALLSQQLRHIGVMKLVGARRTQISLMYIMLILAFGTMALILAVPTGVSAGYALADFVATYLNIDLQGFRVVPRAVLIQAVIALGIPLAAGFFPINRGARTTVRRAISEERPGGDISGSGILMNIGERLVWISRPIMLSIRNTFRRKGRLALTLFTLTMGGAIFIAVFNLRTSLGGFLDLLSDHFVADLTLEFEQPYRNSKVEQVVMQVPGVEGIEAWAGASSEILDEDSEVVTNLYIIAPPAESDLISPDILAGRWFEPGEKNAIAVSDGMLELFPDLVPGDTIKLEVQGKREEDWTVVGIFRFSSPVDQLFGYADYQAVSELYNLTNQSSSFRVTTSGESLQDQEAFGRAIDRVLRSRGFKVRNIEPGLLTLSEASEGINTVVIFLLFMSLLSALVGSIGLTGTMGMNVMERTREIGVMRAIGANDMAIVKSVIIEGSMIGLISWFFASFMSLPFSYFMLGILSDSMFNAPVPLKLAPMGFLYWLSIVLALSVLASVLPARSAARLTIREVLAYE